MAKNGFQKYNSQQILKNFFKDRETYNFKYGLEYGLENSLSNKQTENSLFNLDEDPTVLGFDLYVLDNSPLFFDVDEYIQFCSRNNISEVQNREEIYNDFLNQFGKFFNQENPVGTFKSFKTHYINSIKGLDTLVYKTPVGGTGIAKNGNQFTKFGSDKVTINMAEDVGLNAGYLSSLYRNLIFSKKNGRELIPENLQRFDMAIVICEVRNFNRLVNEVKNPSVDSIKVFNENVDRYIFTLHECQLDFTNYSFEDDITQAGLEASKMGFSKGISFDIYYKFVSYEMEKFLFNPSYDDGEINDSPKYINDQRKKPTTNQVNSQSEGELNNQTNAKNDDKYPERVIDLKYQQSTLSNTDPFKRYEYEFPMINSEYKRSNKEIRKQNREIRENQGNARSEINNLIDFTNQRLQQRVISQRSELISGLAQGLRSEIGLRNIQAPTNVYAQTNLSNFLIDRARDVGNIALSDLLSSGAGLLTEGSQNLENQLFNPANQAANRLKGLKPTPNNSPLSQRGSSDIPNVYKR